MQSYRVLVTVFLKRGPEEQVPPPSFNPSSQPPIVRVGIRAKSLRKLKHLNKVFMNMNIRRSPVKNNKLILFSMGKWAYFLHNFNKTPNHQGVYWPFLPSAKVVRAVISQLECQARLPRRKACPGDNEKQTLTSYLVFGLYGFLLPI